MQYLRHIKKSKIILWWASMHLPPRLENKALLMQLKPPPPDHVPLRDHTPPLFQKPPEPRIYISSLPRMTLYLYYMFIYPWTIHRISLHVFKLYIYGIIKWSEVTQSCPTLCDPTDCSLPGSPVHGNFPGKRIGVGCHFLLQGIFPTQVSNPGLLHCRQMLYPLSH